MYGVDLFGYCLNVYFGDLYVQYVGNCFEDSRFYCFCGIFVGDFLVYFLVNVSNCLFVCEIGVVFVCFVLDFWNIYDFGDGGW